MKQVEIQKDEIIRERAILLTPDTVEIVYEFMDIETGMWEHWDSMFISKEQFDAMKILFDERKLLTLVGSN